MVEPLCLSLPTVSMIPHWIIKAMCFFARIRAVPKPGLTQRHRQRVLRLVCVVALGAAVYFSMLWLLGFRLQYLWRAVDQDAVSYREIMRRRLTQWRELVCLQPAI